MKIKINWQKIKPHLPILAIITMATILRFIALARYGDFWDDEMFNFIYSQKAWPRGLVYWLWETNPPLHLFILKIWLAILPTTEFFTRLPSVIAGTTSVWAIYRLGQVLFNKNTGLLAAFYLAIHPFHILWSTTARVYVFLMLLAILSTYFFYQRFFQNDTVLTSKHSRWLNPFVNLLLIFSHLTSLFLLIGQFILLVGLKRRHEAWRWIKENIIPFSIGGLWIITSFWVKIGNHLEESWFLNMAHTFPTYIKPMINLFAGQYPFFLGTVLLVIIILLSSISFYREAKNKKNQFLILTILILVPLLLSLAFNVWHIKFFLCILPLFVLMISHALTTAFSKSRLTFFAILLICTTGLFNLWKTLPLTDWSSIDTYIKQKPAPTVLVYNYHILKTQIDRYLPTVAETAIPLMIYNDLDWDDMVIKKNYLIKMLTAEEKNIWYKNSGLDKFSSLVLLQNEYKYVTKLSDTLVEHGWQLKQEPETATISGDYKIYWYEKN